MMTEVRVTQLRKTELLIWVTESKVFNEMKLPSKIMRYLSRFLTVNNFEPSKKKNILLVTVSVNL